MTARRPSSRRTRHEHFPNLPADVHERLAARGIDPEHSASSWLQAIRDGSFPVSAFAERPAGNNVFRPQRNHDGRSPGAWRVPSPLPLALVLPADTAGSIRGRGNHGAA